MGRPAASDWLFGAARAHSTGPGDAISMPLRSTEVGRTVRPVDTMEAWCWSAASGFTKEGIRVTLSELASEFETSIERVNQAAHPLSQPNPPSAYGLSC